MQFLVKLVHPEIYGEGGWRVYLSRLAQVGGCIESCPNIVTGSPNVNLFLNPNGDISIISMHDQIFRLKSLSVLLYSLTMSSQPYVLAGVVCPQSTFDNDELCAQAIAIGRVCTRRGIVGYIAIDFVVSLDESTKQTVGLLRYPTIEITLHIRHYWPWTSTCASRLHMLRSRSSISCAGGGSVVITG
jgi:hypothetical protein